MSTKKQTMDAAAAEGAAGSAVATDDAATDDAATGERAARLEGLVGEWLTVPDIAERTGKPLTLVRAWLKDGELIAVRRGERNVISVPADFVDDGGPVPHLAGTLAVLHDARFADDEAIEWLFTPDHTLRTGTPMSDILAGFKTEIRRRAQEMAF